MLSNCKTYQAGSLNPTPASLTLGTVHDRFGGLAMLLVGWMKVNLGLMRWPLTSLLTDQEDDLSFDRLNIAQRLLVVGIGIAPDIKRNFLEAAAPCVAVIASPAICGESQPQASPHALPGNAHVNGSCLPIAVTI
jgi:hypothetical protein